MIRTVTFPNRAVRDAAAKAIEGSGVFVFLSDLQMDISGPKASVEKALAEVRSIEQVWREAPECRHEHVVCADCGQAIQAKAA